ncbi:MAG: type II toxin-antitoxin system HicA family toxin [Thermoplasmata archaeon]
MAKVPRDADARKVIRALEKLGFRVASVSGSHYKLVHEDDPARVVVVPFHGKLKTGTLNAILKAAKVKVEEFLRVFTLL